MVIRAARFNTYLMLVLVSCLAAGCQNAEYKRKQQKAVLRLHMEVLKDGTSFNQPVIVGRNSPISVNVEKTPFLTEDFVASAKIVEVLGGYSLQIKFDRRGTLLLEQYTAANPRRRVAIFSQFGAKLDRARWLAAPVIPRRISDGVLTFTPDTDLKETEEIELGLNNHARKTQPKAEQKP
jgi:hypothetical protein